MKRRFGVAGMTLGGLTLLMTGLMWMTSRAQTQAHCQVPCGIYDDDARITRLGEDATTIAKAISQINQLAATRDGQALNQATRWIATKEAHASHIIEVVAEYFLAQRVKPVSAAASGYETYLGKLADHHRVMVAAMKTKQQVDPAAADTLTQAINRLAAHYKN